MFWIHKHEVAQAYGGPEEGGWWYDTGVPASDWSPLEFFCEEAAYERCRELNRAEAERAEAEEQYGYTSVLSHRSEHFAYSVEASPLMVAYPEQRPHYE